MVLGIGLSGAIFTTVMANSQSPAAFFTATRASFLAAAVLAILGVLTSAIRGAERRQLRVEN
jgi:hypothetical protein